MLARGRQLYLASFFQLINTIDHNLLAFGQAVVYFGVVSLDRSYLHFANRGGISVFDNVDESTLWAPLN